VNRRVFGIGLLLAPVNFLYFMMHVRLDPNPHHDGIVLAASVANSEFLVPNRDFFNQYGPIASEISGIWLRITSPTLLQLRLLHVALLVITGLLMYWFVARRTSIALGTAICVLWTVTAPFYILPVATPWPSVMLNLILTIVILLLCSSKVSENLTRWIYFISIMLTLTVLLRLQSIVSLVFLSIALLVYRRYRDLLSIAAGFCSGVFLASIYFFITKSFPAWFQDCVSWAFDRYATPRTFDKAFIVDTVLWLLFPAISALWFLLTFIYRRSSRSIYAQIFFALFFAIILFANLWTVADKSYLNPLYFLQSSAQNWLNWLGYVSATTLVLLVIVLARKKQMTSHQAVTLVLGLSSLIQLYPAHDALHLWWITPVLVITLVGVLAHQIGLLAKPILVISALTVVVSLFVQIPYVTSPRESFNSPVLSGMRGQAELVRVVDQTAQALSSVPARSYINFDCVDGLYSVLSRKFRATNANMVNWGIVRDVDDAVIHYYFTCYTTDKIKDWYLDNAFESIAEVKIDDITSNILWKK
jgi:hypothetical protein